MYPLSATSVAYRRLNFARETDEPATLRITCSRCVQLQEEYPCSYVSQRLTADSPPRCPHSKRKTSMQQNFALHTHLPLTVCNYQWREPSRSSANLYTSCTKSIVTINHLAILSNENCEETCFLFHVEVVNQLSRYRSIYD